MVWSSLLIYLLDSSENVLRDDDSDFMSRLKYFSLEISNGLCTKYGHEES